LAVQRSHIVRRDKRRSLCAPRMRDCERAVPGAARPPYDPRWWLWPEGIRNSAGGRRIVREAGRHVHPSRAAGQLVSCRPGNRVIKEQFVSIQIHGICISAPGYSNYSDSRPAIIYLDAFLSRISFERQRARLRFGSKGNGEVGDEVPQTIIGCGGSRSHGTLAAVTLMTTTLSTVVLADRRAPDGHLPRTDPP